MLKSLQFYCALFAGALLLSGCGRGETQPKSGTTGGSENATREKVFNFASIGEPKRLDPAFVYDLYEAITSGLLYDGLVNFGKGSDIQPGLAERWEISPDGKTYTFHLRDAKFSNGKTATSADVRYTYTRILKPETNSDRKWLLDKIVGAAELTSGTTQELAGLETPDDKTVIIKLVQPYPVFLTKLAMPSAGIIPEGMGNSTYTENKFDKNPIGTGPWVLEKVLHDQRLEFRRNEHYWGPKPKLDKWVYNIITEDQVQRQQFNIGKIDMYTVGFTAYPQYSRDPKYKDRLVEVPELNTYFLGFGNAKPHLKDKRVRQAVAHGINTKVLYEDIQLKRGTRAHGPVPPGIEGYRPEIEPRAYDPEKSKQLLSEAGVKDLKLKLWYTQEPQNTEFCSAIRSDLEKVGIKVELMPRDLASIRSAIYNGEPDLYLFSWWLDYPDIENSLLPSFASRNIPRGGNGCFYSNPVFDQLLEAAMTEIDPKKRIEMFQQAEDIIIEDCPWVFLYHRKSFILVQEWVKDLDLSLMTNAGRYLETDIDLSLKPQ